MQILSHRGYWKDFKTESNKKVAFERSFDLSYGTETDLRDICGKIVISHDMPKGNEISFENLLEIMNKRNLPLALNIKADGQSDEIIKILNDFNHTNYFTFDMSIPDMVVQINKGLKVFTGYSDILKEPVLLEKADGVWLDSFYSEWFDENTVEKLLEMKKKVCIVSSDLHKRNNDEQWEKISKFKFLNENSLMLCTNEPEKASKFFGIRK